MNSEKEIPNFYYGLKSTYASKNQHWLLQDYQYQEVTVVSYKCESVDKDVGFDNEPLIGPDIDYFE